MPADKDVKRVVFPSPKPFLETLFGDDNTSAQIEQQKVQAAIGKALPADVRRTFRYTALFDEMQQGKAMLMMPFDLRIK